MPPPWVEEGATKNGRKNPAVHCTAVQQIRGQGFPNCQRRPVFCAKGIVYSSVVEKNLSGIGNSGAN